MFCPNCGNQIPDGSAFCPNCGAQQPKQQPRQQYQQPQQFQQAQAQPQFHQTVGRAARKAAKKAGGGLLKKLIGTAALVAVAAVGIPFISGVIEGVKEARNDPPPAVEPIKKDGEMDFADLMGYWKSENGNFELRVEPGEPVSMRYTTPDGLFSSSNGVSVDAKTGRVTLTAADGAKTSLTPQKSGSRLYIPEEEVYLYRLTGESAKDSGDKKNGSICPLSIQRTMHVSFGSSNMQGVPKDAESSDYTAVISIDHDVVTIEFSPYEWHETGGEQDSLRRPAFSLQGHITADITDKSKDYAAYSAEIDGNFIYTEETNTTLYYPSRHRGTIYTTYRGEGDAGHFTIQSYPDGAVQISIAQRMSYIADDPAGYTYQSDDDEDCTVMIGIGD